LMGLIHLFSLPENFPGKFPPFGTRSPPSFFPCALRILFIVWLTPDQITTGFPWFENLFCPHLGCPSHGSFSCPKTVSVGPPKPVCQLFPTVQEPQVFDPLFFFDFSSYSWTRGKQPAFPLDTSFSSSHRRFFSGNAIHPALLHFFFLLFAHPASSFLVSWPCLVFSSWRRFQTTFRPSSLRAPGSPFLFSVFTWQSSSLLPFILLPGNSPGLCPWPTCVSLPFLLSVFPLFLSSFFFESFFRFFLGSPPYVNFAEPPFEAGRFPTHHFLFPVLTGFFSFLLRQFHHVVVFRDSIVCFFSMPSGFQVRLLLDLGYMGFFSRTTPAGIQGLPCATPCPWSLSAWVFFPLGGLLPIPSRKPKYRRYWPPKPPPTSTRTALAACSSQATQRLRVLFRKSCVHPGRILLFLLFFHLSFQFFLFFRGCPSVLRFFPLWFFPP